MQNSYNNNTKASLGCGSLILIAIIVALFSDVGSNRKLDEILKRLEAIERKLDQPR